MQDLLTENCQECGTWIENINMSFDMNNIKTGIVGLGYVGGAIKNAYEVNHKYVDTFDINKSLNSTCNSLKELVNRVNVVYVCVPTPMRENGECDTRIVENVVQEICSMDKEVVVIIKSTVTPGTTQRLQESCPRSVLMFNPEFLTEANYLDDYLNQQLLLIGIPDQAYRTAALLIAQEQLSIIKSNPTIKITDATTAEFFKYSANIFLATKVSFANELESVASRLNVDWNEIKSLLITDARMGKTHWNVPGPDGHRGFGGTCFPKDISAFIQLANSLGIETPIINSVWNRNIGIDRPERDWEQLKGRAVTD